MTFPNKVTFFSDDSELTFIEEQKDKALKKSFAKYRYSKAAVLFNTITYLSLDQVQQLLKDKMIIVE